MHNNEIVNLTTTNIKREKNTSETILSRSFFPVYFFVFFHSLNTKRKIIMHRWIETVMTWQDSFAQWKKFRKNSVQLFSTTHQRYHHRQAHSFYAHTHWLWLIKIHWLISYNYYSYWLIHNLKSIGRAEEFKTHSIMLPVLLITYTLHTKHTLAKRILLSSGCDCQCARGRASI